MIFSFAEHVFLDNFVIFSFSAHVFNLSNFAYIVVAFVIGLLKSNSVSYESDVYHPANTNPSFVGLFFGFVTFFP